MDGITEGSEPQVDLLMASLRADQVDVATYFTTLCDKLVDALGARARVSGTSGLFRKRGSPSQLTVSIGERQFVASINDGVVSGVERHVVRGVALGTEELDFAEWLAHVVSALAAEAKRSESTRIALERLLA